MNSIQLMSDDDISKELGQRFDRIRRHKRIKDKVVLEKSGVSSSVLAKFRSGKGTITLKTFIKLLRSIDELDQIAPLLNLPEVTSLIKKEPVLPKRIRSKESKKDAFVWADEVPADKQEGDL